MTKENVKIVEKNHVENSKARIFFGIFLFISVSSLVLLNKEHLRSYNIIINSGFILFYFIWSMWKNKKYFFNNIILVYSIFTLFAFLSVSWSTNVDISLHLFVRLVSILGSMITLYSAVKTLNLYNYAFGSFFFTSFVNFILFLADPFFSLFEIYESGRFVGTMENSNALAIAMIYSVFLSIIYLIEIKTLRWNIAININIFVSLYIILVTLSRKGFLAGSFLFLLYITSLTSSKYRTVAAVISVLIIFYLAFFSDIFLNVEDAYVKMGDRFEGLTSLDYFESRDYDASVEERVYFVESGWKMFLEKPVIGWGINTFLIFHDGKYAHNNYIELLVGTGIAGMTLFYIIYLIVLLDIFKFLSGRVRLYFLALFLFILIMDFSLVSYYSRLYFMFVVFSVLYIDKFRKEKYV
jgi:O-antigen ligase